MHVAAHLQQKPAHGDDEGAHVQASRPVHAASLMDEHERQRPVVAGGGAEQRDESAGEGAEIVRGLVGEEPHAQNGDWIDRSRRRGGRELCKWNQNREESGNSKRAGSHRPLTMRMMTKVARMGNSEAVTAAVVLFSAGIWPKRWMMRTERTSLTSHAGTAGTARATKERATAAVLNQFQLSAAKRMGLWAATLRASSRAKAAVKKALSLSSARPRDVMEPSEAMSRSANWAA